VKRQKDHGELKVDNSQVMDILMQALEGGEEGTSRYHPKVAPLKTRGKMKAENGGLFHSLSSAVTRIASGILSRNRENPEFEITILTCPLAYM